ncbi:MAG: hypothetical protein A3J38_08210, partial [Gammaproteobacteria bacterium RIFCSPHIGHO2_12_FULL_45_9]
GMGLDLPTFDILPCPLTPTETVLLHTLTPDDWLIATSQHVAASLPLPLPATQRLAIGRQTATTLHTYTTLSWPTPPQAHSEALLTYLRTQTIAHHARIILLSGEGGRDIIQHTLQAAGYDVQKWICYQRQFRLWSPEAVQQLHQTPPHVWLAFSGETLHFLKQNLIHYQLTTLQHIPVLAISERIVKVGQSLGFSECRLVSQEKLLPVFSQWHCKRQQDRKTRSLT